MDISFLLIIPIDKQKHFFVSLFLFIIFLLIRRYYLKEKWLFRQAAFSLRDTLIVWIFKEIIDLFWFWNPDLTDFFSDSLWVIFPIYIYFLYKESKNIKIHKFFRLESQIIKKLEDKTFILYKRFLLFVDVQLKIYMFKRKILYFIPSRTREFLFKKALNDFLNILWFSIQFSLIWLLNLILITIKIPFWALNDTIETFIKLLQFSFWVKKVR